jgi:hypothetical protein
MDKKDIKDSAKEIVYFGDIIIIHLTNVKVVIMMWNGGLKEKRRDWITR